MLEIKCPEPDPLPVSVKNNITPKYKDRKVCDLELCDFVECKIEDYESKMDYFDDFYLQISRWKYLPLQ